MTKPASAAVLAAALLGASLPLVMAGPASAARFVFYDATAKAGKVHDYHLVLTFSRGGGSAQAGYALGTAKKSRRTHETLRAVQNQSRDVELRLRQVRFASDLSTAVVHSGSRFGRLGKIKMHFVPASRLRKHERCSGNEIVSKRRGVLEGTFMGNPDLGRAHYFGQFTRVRAHATLFKRVLVDGGCPAGRGRARCSQFLTLFGPSPIRRATFNAIRQRRIVWTRDDYFKNTSPHTSASGFIFSSSTKLWRFHASGHLASAIAHLHDMIFVRGTGKYASDGSSPSTQTYPCRRNGTRWHTTVRATNGHLRSWSRAHYDWQGSPDRLSPKGGHATLSRQTAAPGHALTSRPPVMDRSTAPWRQLRTWIKRFDLTAAVARR